MKAFIKQEILSATTAIIMALSSGVLTMKRGMAASSAQAKKYSANQNTAPPFHHKPALGIFQNYHPRIKIPSHPSRQFSTIKPWKP